VRNSHICLSYSYTTRCLVAVEAGENPLDPATFQVDDINEDTPQDSVEDLIDLDGIEECLKALEEGILT